MSNTMTQEEAMNMSNEQAVQILIPMRNMMFDQYGCPISDAVFAIDKAIEALSTDKPQEIIAQVTFDEEKLRKIVKETIERFKKEYEVIDRPQGAWITVWDECGENENGYECSECGAEVDEKFPNCPYCLARMKGIDDE